MSVAHELVLRAENAAATRDRFFGTTFEWGSADCVSMAAHHLRGAGHEPALARGGAYRSAAGARKALRRAGFATIAAALDSFRFERIAPAAALVGDILSGDADDPLGALGVYLGNGALLGWVEDQPSAAILRSRAMTAAWRVPHG